MPYQSSSSAPIPLATTVTILVRIASVFSVIVILPEVKVVVKTPLAISLVIVRVGRGDSVYQLRREPAQAHWTDGSVYPE